MNKKILIVEDDAITSRLLEKQIHDLGYSITRSVTTGEGAIRSVAKDQPHCVLMDITLEGDIDGIDAARHIHENHNIPVVYISSSSDSETLQRALETNPSGYIIKPVDRKELKAAVDMAILRKEMENRLIENELKFFTILNSIGDAVIVTDSSNRITYMNPIAERLVDVKFDNAVNKKLKEIVTLELNGDGNSTNDRIMGDIKFNYIITKSGRRISIDYNASPIENIGGTAAGTVIVFRDNTIRVNAEKKLKEGYSQVKRAMNGIIQAIAHTVETRDLYTAGHQKRVSDLARAIAYEMDLPGSTIEGIRMAGLIHDLGKISIPVEILSKPGRLNELEMLLIRNHSQVGHDILTSIDFPWPLDEIVYQHHERLDGSGYPRGIAGDDILLEARIISIADVVEAMASHRPYRASLGIESALDEIEKNRGTIYDRDVADSCLKLFREKGYRMEYLKSSVVFF